MRLCEFTNCDYPAFARDKNTNIYYCKAHQGYRTDTDKRTPYEKALDKRKKEQQTNSTKTKVRSLIHTEENKLVANQAAEDINKLLQWFKYVAEIIAEHPQCWNCGAFIPQKFYKAASAHVLPKRKEYGFPSVSTHPDNYLILGAGCGCHAKYDRSWDDAASMEKIWHIAIAKFLKIYPLIDKAERKNIPEVLLQELEPKL